MQLQIENVADKTTLDVTIWQVVFFTFSFCMGFFFELGKFTRTHDTFWLYGGLFTMFLGAIGTAYSIMLVHAIVRHMTQDSSNSR